MIAALRRYRSDRGSITAIEAAITMSIGLLFAVGAYIFQQHSADITTHDKCVVKMMAEGKDENGQPYHMADPDLMTKINSKCSGGGQ
jgi:hypothetical protein